MAHNKLEKIVKTYRTLAEIPAIVGGQIQSANLINITFSQRNIETGSIAKFSRSLFLNDLKIIDNTLPVIISTEILSKISPSKKFKALVRENDSKQFLEIWKNSNLYRVVDLAAADLHGNIYADAEFSTFEFSPDESKILYVAEKKIAKSDPFYKRKKPDEDSNKDNKPISSAGQEYLFEQDWGEQLVGKKRSILAQYNIESDIIEILAGLPDENICFAQAKYSLNGQYLIGVAYFTDPRKLGLIYCPNRLSTLFQFDLITGSYLQLSLKNKAVKSPIFTPDGKTIVWLQREVGGPHMSCMQLVKTSVPLSVETEIVTVVDIVKTSKKIKNDKLFYGIYNTQFPKRPWINGHEVIINTNQNYTINSYVVNIETGEIRELEYDNGSQIIIDVQDNLLLAVRRNFLIPDTLFIGKFDQEIIKWNQLTENIEVPELKNSIYHYFNLVATDGGTFSNFNAIYVGPKNGKDDTVPLILWPHGGPHSAFANYFFLELSVFLSLGFAVLLVNYRGSIGAGEDSVNSLLGKVGTADVADCIQAVEAALKEYPWLNSKKVALCGGSHGGFLVTHLSGQYPEKFQCVVARNPVIDIASMSITSDIPDWCYVEAGESYTQKGKINNDLLLKMRNSSPIIYAHKVKAPTMLQIGSKDLRVPSQQGHEYYHRLKANGVNVKMNLYDDNHPLGTVPNEMDNVINTMLWINEHLEL